MVQGKSGAHSARFLIEMLDVKGLKNGFEEIPALFITLAKLR